MMLLATRMPPPGQLCSTASAFASRSHMTTGFPPTWPGRRSVHLQQRLCRHIRRSANAGEKQEGLSSEEAPRATDENRTAPVPMPFKTDPSVQPTGLEGFLGVPDRTEGVKYTCQGIPVPVANPKFIYFFLGANLTIHGILGGVRFFAADKLEPFLCALANDHQGIWEGDYGRLLTASWLFPNLLSLVVNTLAVAQLGPEVEAIFGYKRFNYLAILIAISGSVGSCATHTTEISYGGSGILLGFVGALAVYFARHGLPDWKPLQALFILAVVGYDIYLGLSGAEYVDNINHISSFVAGAALSFGLGPSWEVVEIPDSAISASGISTPGVEDVKGFLQDTVPNIEQAKFVGGFVFFLMAVLYFTAPQPLQPAHFSTYWVRVLEGFS